MELYISIFSALLAILATAVSVWTLYETRRISKVVVNNEMLEFGNEILVERPETLRLHGITTTDLASCEMSIHDFMYLLNSLQAGQSFHYISGKSKVALTAYRKNMLRQPGVKQAWQNLIREKMLAPGPYSSAIDAFYEEER